MMWQWVSVCLFPKHLSNKKLKCHHSLMLQPWLVSVMGPTMAPYPTASPTSAVAQTISAWLIVSGAIVWRKLWLSGSVSTFMSFRCRSSQSHTAIVGTTIICQSSDAVMIPTSAIMTFSWNCQWKWRGIKANIHVRHHHHISIQHQCQHGKKNLRCASLSEYRCWRSYQ